MIPEPWLTLKVRPSSSEISVVEVGVPPSNWLNKVRPVSRSVYMMGSPNTRVWLAVGKVAVGSQLATGAAGLLSSKMTRRAVRLFIPP